MTSPSKAIEHIACSICGKKATRIGAQDACDVYACTADNTHTTRIHINAPRTEWKNE